MTDSERELMMAVNAVLLSGKRQVELERARLQAAVDALTGEGPATLRVLRERAVDLLAGRGDLAALRVALLAYAQSVTETIRSQTAFRPSRTVVPTSAAVIAGLIED
ncbi:hypothetical protein [Azospirillum picis]|uniref:Uncharacterized protein n=1 Tax=Azospirillum picis TaxID=488438 RepID=A0ABU0MV02_9PROT|nr:hypothetical protein [Azospirillum picis]MBP2303306.1 hypothetical protein [Azospirillum picis]MDQ0537154.1 hypothetical protein [Azospirillum picis]